MDLWIYGDETTFERGTPATETAGYGVLVTTAPIGPAVVDEALIALEADKDRHDPRWKKQDDATLANRYFHGAHDSQNAHSHFCTARGIYRDPVRSSRSHFVKTSGLRWLSLMLLAEIPWAGRVWALPFLTILAPSLRYDQKRQRRHKTLPEWGRQMLLQLRRWLPERSLVVVVDSGYAALDFLGGLANRRHAITCITRLRLDAQLYAPAPPRYPGQIGRPRRKGARLPSLRQRVTDPGGVSWNPRFFRHRT